MYVTRLTQELWQTERWTERKRVFQGMRLLPFEAGETKFETNRQMDLTVNIKLMPMCQPVYERDTKTSILNT